MSSAKRATVRAFLLKAEASYAGGGSLSNSTDGMLLAGPAPITVTPMHDGARVQPPGMEGNMRRVAPSGFEIAHPILHEMKGGVSAYSASVVPSGHRALLASGFDGAVTTTGGSEKWDYTPTPATGTPTSLVTKAFDRGQEYPATGVYLTLDSIECPDQGIPLWTFGLRGIKGTIADTAHPSITYPNLTTEPPKSTSMSFAFGDWAANAVVRAWSLRMNHEISPRGNQNNTGHSGFTRGRRNPIVEFLVEATAFVNSPFHTSAGLSPWAFFEAATEVTSSWQTGTVQYNRIKYIPGKLQMTGPPVEEEDGPTALWRITAQLNPTTVNGNDDLTIRAD